jgi:hypothetical protein
LQIRLWRELELTRCCHPSAVEFETAYQVRVAIERIRFAIKHTEHFAQPSSHLREANLELLDAPNRLESVDRRFQIRSRILKECNGGNPLPERKGSTKRGDGSWELELEENE